MRLITFLASLIFTISVTSCAQDKIIKQENAAGEVRRYEKFPSKLVDARNIDVWLPPNYEVDKDKTYAVLYMHDGQNLFNPEDSYGGVDWGVDETMTRLIAEKKINEAIIVGAWNTPKRLAEYMPQKAYDLATDEQKQQANGFGATKIESDSYLKFLVTELKPFIDQTYRTKADRKNTFVMGSSMGGLISLYAISEYPEVFGGAGCVSTHFPAVSGVMIEYMKKFLPAPIDHKIYFDCGTQTLDSQYEPFQIKADAVMKEKGFVSNKNWITRRFEGEEHSEKSWRKRVDIPLTFFLSKNE